VIRWRTGVVASRRRAWSGAVELVVTLENGAEARALAYPALVGDPQPGDRVLLNVSTLELGLGTGGYAMVVALPDRLPPDPATGPGHMVKARYTPLQTVVLGVDEQESEHHGALREADDLAGMPVIVADLHSALPAVLAGLRADAPEARVAYVATDGGALPLWFSRTVDGLRAAGWLVGTVTAGQAYGGDLEAVTLHTGLLAARVVLGADIAVVAQGPGNLGTAAVLGGRPVAALRVSGADARERHRGVSHHSLTAYGRVALAPADVVVPALEGSLAELGTLVRAQSAPLAPPHRLVEVGLAGLQVALGQSPVGLSTMGRGLADDPAAFLASAAAGRHAAALIG